jgi:hypothetical protein
MEVTILPCFFFCYFYDSGLISPGKTVIKSLKKTTCVCPFKEGKKYLFSEASCAFKD